MTHELISEQVRKDSLAIANLGLEIGNLGLTVEQMQQVLEFAQALHKKEAETCSEFHYAVEFIDNLGIDAAINSSDMDTAEKLCVLSSPIPFTRADAEQLLLAQLGMENPLISRVHISCFVRVIDASQEQKWTTCSPE